MNTREDSEVPMSVLEERYGTPISEDEEPTWDSHQDDYREEGIKFLDQGVQHVDRKRLQPLKNTLQKLDAHLQEGVINYHPCEDITDIATDTRVSGMLRSVEKKLIKSKIRVTDRSDRATVDSVLDNRTRTILLKMMNRGVFSEIFGVISAGKEANVYHAVDSSGNNLAIKVYKTSILGFRDRDRYVSGDFRFRKGYSHSNPRKMVQTWAEKEMRNLNRLRAGGIKAPSPVEHKMHVLVMDFVGVNNTAALRLKDADLSLMELRKVHKELCLILWKLYSQCKLVHADFSEYNILYCQGDCVIIDVSQSVDLDHPLMLDFLREDCQHFIDFFRRKGYPTLTLRELFEFVTDPTVVESNANETLDKLIAQSEQRFVEDVVKEDESEVFKNVFLPRRLDEVVDYERDVENVKQGKNDGVYYQTIMGLKEDLSGVRLVPKIIEDGNQQEEESSESNEEEGVDEDEVPSRKAPPKSKEETKAERKENKKNVKEANRERRKTKLPKHVKKQLLKKGKRKH